MEQVGYVRALAGLLIDPIFDSEFEQVVPGKWIEAVTVARKSDAVKNAAKRSAGLREDINKSSRAEKMLSIFCSVTSDNVKASEKVYWPSKELKMEEKSLFPTSDKGINDSGKKVWQIFLEEATKLRDVYKDGDEASLPLFIENLMLLMQRFLWSAPCAYASLPDTSLYDHGRMTAALAALDSPDSLLVGGDISGLQDFIYTISADGAVSALRGRSFYLQLLNETLPRLILRTLGLPHTNLIYAGGGNFYLLANSGDNSRLEGLREKISRILLTHHRGELYLALASIPLKDDDFFGGKISNRWGDLGSALQHVKQQRFSELGADLKDLFKPKDHGGNEEAQCRVCGLEHPKTHERSDNKPRICPPCEEFEDLGRDLRKAQYFALTQIENDKIPEMVTEPGTWKQVLKTLGFHVTISRDEKAPSITGPATLFSLQDENTSKLKPRIDLAVGRRFFVNVTPIVQEQDKEDLKGKEVEKELELDAVKPFDALQEQASGVKRLGVLRMDVDNLGRLFSDGFKDIQTSLARIASLSFAVSLYFEGWVEKLAEARNRADGIDRLYSIYSGGDDLFFVGSWDAVVELAREIRFDLSRYAAHHPGIHASAGIILISGKYPLYQAAGDAGDAEEKAKSYHNEKDEVKNAITFLNQTVSWDLFGMDDCKNEGADKVHALTHQLVNMLKEEEGKPKPPRALLGILINLQGKFTKAASERMLEGRDRNKSGGKQVLFGPWQWLGFYYLKRMVKREESRNQDFANKVDKLNEQLKTNNFSNIEWIGLSARWAELLIRKSE